VSGPAQGKRPDVEALPHREHVHRYLAAALRPRDEHELTDLCNAALRYVKELLSERDAAADRVATLEREKAVLGGALREAVEWVVDAADGGDPIAERQLASIRSVLAKDLSKNFGAALSDSSQGQRRLIYAREYGVKADGLHDDTAALQNAIDAAAACGGVVIVPHGTRLEGDVRIPSSQGQDE
jgi:hypothetical protein